MRQTYLISIGWIKEGDYRSETYEMTGHLPDLLAEAHDRSIDDGVAIADPERVDISAAVKHP
jgi:hypothetical protein